MINNAVIRDKKDCIAVLQNIFMVLEGLYVPFSVQALWYRDNILTHFKYYRGRNIESFSYTYNSIKICHKKVTDEFESRLGILEFVYFMSQLDNAKTLLIKSFKECPKFFGSSKHAFLYNKSGQ